MKTSIFREMFHYLLLFIFLQFLIYGSYFAAIAGIFLIRGIYTIILIKCQKNIAGNPQRSEAEDQIINGYATRL